MFNQEKRLQLLHTNTSTVVIHKAELLLNSLNYTHKTASYAKIMHVFLFQTKAI